LTVSRIIIFCGANGKNNLSLELQNKELFWQKILNFISAAADGGVHRCYCVNVFYHGNCCSPVYVLSVSFIAFQATIFIKLELNVLAQFIIENASFC